MIENQKIKWVYGLSALFIALNALFIVKEFYWLSLLPVIIIIILLALVSLDKLMFLIVFLTPFSIQLEELDFDIGVALPTEPLMFGVMILFFIKLFYEKKIDHKVLNHPVTLVIIFSLLWTFITSVTSEMPLVSFKFFISNLWFIVCFYFIAIQLFKNYSNIKRFFWMYMIPLTIVIIYTIIHHSFFNFEHKPAHWVMTPFFKDHTSYGAILVMFFPVLFLFFKNKYSNTIRLLVTIVFLIFTSGILLSYTRAAWISLIVAFGLFFVYMLRIKFRTLLAVFALLAGLFFALKSEIVMKLEKNRQESSNDISEHVQSISNITSDASNLERINRWEAAFRMFEERPVFGWGPGTYAFLYAPFQLSKEITIISTNAGDMGNAHSEYIGPLAEQGLLGSLSFLLILISVYYCGSKLYFKLTDKDSKQIVLVVLLGLTTYFVHGTLNNFLDTDKASVPFWGFIAILTAMDIYHSKEKTLSPSSEEKQV